MPEIDLDALEAMRAALDALTVGSGEWIEAWERYADTCAYAAPALIAAARERDALKAERDQLALELLTQAQTSLWHEDDAAKVRNAHADLVAALVPALQQAVEALDWYEEQVGDCRKLTSEGEGARKALDRDCGHRARSALATLKSAIGDQHE